MEFEDFLTFQSFFIEEEEDEQMLLFNISRRRSPRYRYNTTIERRMSNPEVSLLALQNVLQQKDAAQFRRMVRMDIPTYNILLELVRPYLTKKTTNFGPPHSAELRLAVTVRYLSTGDSQYDISLQYGIGSSTVCEILQDAIEAIYLVLRDDYLQTPSTEEEWSDVAKVFQSRWNFPNCFGAIDGKHINIKPPNKSGATFLNYKHNFSIVLMAIVDANYRFIFVDAGSEGRANDGGVWRQCSIKDAIDDNDVNLPTDRKLPGTNNITPMFLVGDDAFPLGEHLLKPYSRRHLTESECIFNYRLSRARRIAENAFGILANKFRIFLQTIEATADHVMMMVVACCALHNFLRERLGDNFIVPGSVDFEDENHRLMEGEWRRDVTLEGLARDPARNPSAVAKGWRNLLCDYFVSSAGKVPWQMQMVYQ